MKTKVIRFRIDPELESRVKKIAAGEGKSVSDTIRSLILKSLSSGSDLGGSGPQFDPETIGREVANALSLALDPLEKQVRAMGAELAGMTAPAGVSDLFAPEPPIPPKVLRYLVEKVGRINAMVNGLSARDVAGHDGRCKQAEAMAIAETKTLLGG